NSCLTGVNVIAPVEADKPIAVFAEVNDVTPVFVKVCALVPVILIPVPFTKFVLKMLGLVPLQDIPFTQELEMTPVFVNVIVLVELLTDIPVPTNRVLKYNIAPV